MKKQKPRTAKEECHQCPATCCKNLAMIIGRPHTKAEIEDLKWQIRFNTVKVYIHNRKWHLWIKGTCMYLSKNNRCTVYETRPNKCREYNPPHCEAFGKFYDIILSTPDELEDYLARKSKKNQTKKINQK